ncbi:hypothetical protein N7523_011169 [Penicillium sp. IBT 18751x]|nr:hypothetical protein N7523_011169 [Penicillium sp. IBT 18751x]
MAHSLTDHEEVTVAVRSDTVGFGSGPTNPDQPRPTPEVKRGEPDRAGLHWTGKPSEGRQTWNM